MRLPTHGRLGFMAGIFALSASLPLATASAHHPDDGSGHPELEQHIDTGLDRPDPNAALEARDAETEGIISDGPFADVIKNLDVAGRGERLSPDGTTDVWTLDGHAYTGTFNSPCGGEEGAGVWVWDVSNVTKPGFVTVIESPAGSRSNDVKVANMNSGRVLVHSNESCGGGVGGFEIYNVDDPANPVFLAHVQVDEIAEITPLFFGGPGSLDDNGVHNLWLFSQGDKDYVAAASEGVFDGFQIFDITDPTAPALVSGWGAEELFDPGVGDLTLADDPTGGRTLTAVLWMLDGFGASRNRFLHDFTLSADGTKAYLAHWDAGLVLLDISDPANPQVVSVAIDPVNGSLDGEVNSHSVWPSADGSIVVEGEEDFSVFAGDDPLGNFTFQDRPTNTIPGVGISTNAGTEFENSQTGNVVTVDANSVTVDSGPLAGNSYVATEGSGNQPRFADTGPITGEAVWIGRACNGDPILNAAAIGAGGIAVVRRGACFFGDKLANAAAAGAVAIVVSNNAPDSVWSGVRVWDYADPANPVLTAIFDTVCSSEPRNPSCDPRGTYSSHNVIVENEGNKVKAYISWYSDGVVVLDVTDPYNPVETARYHREGLDFEAENGGIQDVWGIYKEPGSPWVYASDRNGGLYVLKELGSGTAKMAEN